MSVNQHPTLGIGRSLGFLLSYLVLFGFLARDWLALSYVALPRDLHTDGWFIYWVLGWVGDTLTSAPSELFNPPINWPAENQLAGSEHFAAWQVGYLPLRYVLGSELAAMNVTLFLGYVFAAWLTALLLLQLGCAPVVAWLGGLIFGSTDVAFGAMAMPHGMQVGNLFLPWTALCITRLREAPTWPRGIHLTLALILGFLSSYYMAVVLVLLASLWGSYELVRNASNRGRYLSIAVASAAIASVVVLAFSAPYFRRPEVAGDPDRVVSMWQVGHLVGEKSGEETVGLFKAKNAAQPPDDTTQVHAEPPFNADVEIRKLALVRVLPLLRALLVLAAIGALFMGRSPLPHAAIGGVVLLAGGAFVALPALVEIGTHTFETPVAYLLRNSPARFVRQTMRLSPIWHLGLVLLTGVGLDMARRAWPGLPFATIVLLLVATDLDRRLDPTTVAFAHTTGADELSRKVFARHYPLQDPLTGFFNPPMAANRTLGADARSYERMAEIIETNGGGPVMELPSDLARAESIVGQRVLDVPSIYFYSGYVPPHTLLIKALADELPAPEPLQDLVGLTGLRWLIVRLDTPRGESLRKGFAHGIGLGGLIEERWRFRGFLLMKISQKHRNQHWIGALQRGPQAGMSLLGYPRVAVSAEDLDYQVRISAAVPPTAGVPSPYVVSVLNPGPPLPAARPDRPDEDLSVRLRFAWRSVEDGRTVPEPMTTPLRRDVPSMGYLVQRQWIQNPPEPGRYELTARLEQLGHPAFETSSPETSPYRIGSLLLDIAEDAPDAGDAEPGEQTSAVTDIDSREE